MPQLTVNYSTHLLELLREGRAAIDGIEVGAWFTPQQIEGFRQALPGVSFTYHAGSLASSFQTKKMSFSLLREYLVATGSRWLSFHIELLPLYIYALGSRLGIHLRPPDREAAKLRYLDFFSQVRAAIGAPFILENLMSLPPAKYHYASDPQTIAEIVERTGAGFLLDIAHARVAADYRKQDVHQYLESLPLAKVEQIHASGARRKNGVLYDAHEPMQEEDYRLLEWVLGKCQPEMVTLEYFREKEALRQQCLRMSAIMNDGRGYQ